MKANGVVALEQKWVGKPVRCFVRDYMGVRRGPYFGQVTGLSTNEATMEDEGGDTYEATGLLVDLPTLGRNSTYGEWPVRFTDVEIDYAKIQSTQSKGRRAVRAVRGRA